MLCCIACNTTKFVPEGKYLLNKVQIKSKPQVIDPNDLTEYLKQQPNYKVFGLWNMRLGIYSLAGQDSTKRRNRFIKNLGSPPVIYDEDLTVNTALELQRVFYNKGYMDATVIPEVTTKNKKASVTYRTTLNKPYYVNKLSYNIQEENIERLILKDSVSSLINPGMLFDGDVLDQERTRIVNQLKKLGYYSFSKENIHYFADSSQVTHQIDLTLDIRAIPVGTEVTDSLKASQFRQEIYRIKDVYFLIDNAAQSHRRRLQNGFADPDTIAYEGYHIVQDENSPFRSNFLLQNCFIRPHSRYNENDVTATYNALSSLQALRYANIRFEEVNSTWLNCYISLTSAKSQTISTSLEGTNSAGDLGVAGNINYQHRNIFHGSEVFSFKVRGAYEALSGNVTDLWNNNYTEIGAETSILFPKFQFPFLNKDFKKRLRASTEYVLAFGRQARPEYERIVFSGSWRYKWSVGQNGKHRHTIDPFFFDYIHVPRMSQEFVEDLERYPALLNSFKDHVIGGISYSYYTSNQGLSSKNKILYSVRATVESSGNALYGISKLLGNTKDEEGQYNILNAPISQYVKGNVDFSRTHIINTDNSFAYHIGMGVAYPYLNSTILPFEKSFYSGGANSVRGWSVRTLGPGTYRYSGQTMDYVYQTGDIRLDMNVEWRSHIFWLFQLAAYVDAGNIWTIRNYPSQPGGQFKFDEFYKQIAASYGLGLRLDFKYFLVRLDTGMKAYDPSMITESRWVMFNPSFSRDFAIHFAIGYPF